MRNKSVCCVRGYILSNYHLFLNIQTKKTPTWLGSNTYVEKNYKKVNFNVLRSFLTTKQHHTLLMID